MQDLENRITGSRQAQLEHQKESLIKMKKVEKFIEVYQPMHTFKLVSKTLHACLTEESYNKCLDYEHEMWPELL